MSKYDILKLENQMCFPLYAISREVIKLYKEHHQEPPIYKSANTPGGDEHNKKLYEHYKSRIKSLY